MDAISFVLGVKSAQLRSSQLKDLVYRDRSTANAEDNDEGIDDEEYENENNPRKAYVTAFYETKDGDEIRFTRTFVSVSWMFSTCFKNTV